MIYQEQYDKLLYQYEIVRARLEIREHFLRTVTKEIYENIGQVLSLIRVQLSLLQIDFKNGKKEKIDSSGELVGKTIRDLRSMCKLFYPEANISNAAGFSQAFQYEVETISPSVVLHVDQENMPKTIKEEKALVLFGIFLEILTLISQKQHAVFNSATLKYTQDKIHISIDYTGEAIRKKKNKMAIGFFDLNIFERAELIGGSLQVKSTGAGQRRIKLVTTIN